MRRPEDYQKVRRLVGWLLRNRRFQAARVVLAAREYLQVGCGPLIAPGYVNLDYRWVPGVDVVWDINRPLPFPAGRFRGIFTEHCLEHLGEPALDRVLAELFRVLRPGGRARLVVPSLEIHAQRYLATRSETDDEPAHVINRVFYSGHDWMTRHHWFNDGHHFIHDFASLAARLRAAGFAKVERAAFNRGADPRLLIDRADREWESLYLEGVKSAPPAP